MSVSELVNMRVRRYRNNDVRARERVIMALTIFKLAVLGPSESNK